MKKTIFHDAMLNFGKYRGQSVEKILVDDPGYFLWLRESETYALDEIAGNRVDAWAGENKKDADKVRWSANNAKIENAIKARNTAIAVAVDDADSVTTDVSFAKPAKTQANWGTW